MKAEQQVKPRMSTLTQAVLGELRNSSDIMAARFTEDKEKIEAGTHRFDIHPGQAIFLRPQGFLVDREEDRLRRMARNDAAIALAARRYVEVTDDGFIIRERKMSKRDLKLVKSNGDI